MTYNTPNQGLRPWFTFLIFLCGLSIGSTSWAQPVLAWDKGYGGAGWEDCNSAIQTADLGYLLGGITTSDNSGDMDYPTQDDLTIPWWIPNVRGDYWVLRTDENGDELWNARFGGNREDRLWGVEQTTDGGFILGGSSYSELGGDKTDTCRGDADFWVVKIDPLGVKEWDRTYGGDSTDILNVLLTTQDGGYILGGSTLSSGWSLTDSLGEKSDTIRGRQDWWIVKIDQLGDIEWERTYGGNDREQLLDIVQRPDGTYIAAGGSESTLSGEVDSVNVGSRDFWMLHLDLNGDKLNEYRYGSVEFDDMNQVILTNDGGYLLAGSSYATVPSGDKTDPGFGAVTDLDWWIIKIDLAGNIEWQHTFGGSDIENVYSISQNSVDHYLLGGYTRSMDGTLTDNPPKGGSDYWIMYLDPAGNRLWDERYGGDESESLEQLFQTNDGGYLMAGHSRSDVNGDHQDHSNGLNDFWIVKTLCNINVDLADTIVCPGDDVIISAYDPNCLNCIYTWGDDNSITDSIRIISTQMQASYAVTLTDGVGCQREDDIVISVHTPPTVDLGNDQQICPGDPLTINANNSGLDFLWNTEEVTQMIEVDYPGTYTVSVTDAIGCTTPDSMLVTVSQLQAYVTTTNTFCGQDNGTATVFASGGTGSYSYNWVIGGSNDMINNLAIGEYAVLVDDGECSVLVKGIVGFDEPPVIDWEHNYGGSAGETFHDAKQTADGGFIVLSSSSSADFDLSSNAGGQDVWVKKLSAAGNIEWQQSYGGSQDEVGRSIEIDENGGYIITGYTLSNNGDVNGNHGARDVWVLRIDDLGSILWSRTYGGTDWDEGIVIQQTWEGGYIIGAISLSNDGDVSNPVSNQDLWIVKLDFNGQIEWQRSYGGAEDEWLTEIEQTPDGGYFIGAYSRSNVPANYGANDFYILKIDARGEAEWRNNLGGSGEDQLQDFVQTIDGGYLLLGTSASNDIDVSGNNGGVDTWLVKVNAFGGLLWQRSIGGLGADNGMSINKTGDGNFIIGGFSFSTDGDIAGNNGLLDYIIIKVDDAGNPIWSQNYGTSFIDNAELAFQTSDGAYLLAGQSGGSDIDGSANYGDSDTWLIKLDAPPLPNVSLPNDLIICEADTATFSPNIMNCVNCTWTWSDGNNDSTRVETPSTDTNYEIVITDEYGCTSTDMIHVMVNPLPQINLPVTEDLCEGETLPLNAGTNGIIFQWNTNEVSQIINVDTAGTYAVTITDANNCSAEDSTTVSINALPMVDLGVDTALCDGLNYLLDAGNSGANFQWSSGGGTNQTLSVSSPDNYSVTVTDSNNCSAEDAVNVSFDAIPQPVTIDLLDPGLFCPGTIFNINIQDSQLGVQYELFDGSNLSGGSVLGNGGAISIPTDPVMTTTTFNIVASFSGMCADTLMASTIANIGDNEAPVVSCRADTAISIENGDCNPILLIGAPTSVTDNCGLEALTYVLSGATTMSSPTTGFNDASGLSYNNGLTTVTYTVIDSFGNIAFCQFNVEVVDQTEPLVGTPANDMVVECDGTGNQAAFDNWLLVHAGADAFDACSPLSWTTIPANPMVSDECGETGSIEVTFVASDTSGNQVMTMATFTIQDTQAPDFTVPGDITIGVNDDPTDLTISGDVIDESDNCDGGVSDQGPRFASYVDVVAVDDCSDVITRTWTLTDECGNQNQQVQTITKEFTPPTGSLSGATDICAGDPATITFNLNGGFEYNVIYNDGDQDITLLSISDGHAIVVMPTVTTTYTLVSVVETARIDCEGTIGSDVEIIVNEVPEAINIEETCDLLNTSYVVTFEITGGDVGTYIVTGDGGTLTGNMFESVGIPKDSTYTFFLDDGNGCGPLEITGSYDCQCETESGNVTENMLTVCGDEVIIANHENENLDGNDLIEFIVHNGDAGNIGMVLYTTNIPEFSYQTNMTYGVTYFMTIIAGTDDGSGNVADIDACYSESVGVPIVFYEPPTAVISTPEGTELDCIDNSLHLSGSTSQTQGGITFDWSVDGAGNIVGGTTFDLIEVDEPGNYVLTITDLATGCTASTTMVISLDAAAPNAVINPADELSCVDTLVQLDATGSSVGNNFSYQWSGGMIESGDQTLEPTVSLSEIYTLVVMNSDNGCRDTAQVFVEENINEPIVNAGESPQLDCVTPEVTLSGSYTTETANVTLQWLPVSGNITLGENTLTPTVDEGGFYTLYVTDLGNGCTGEATVEVTVDPSTPTGAALESIDPECYGDDNGSVSIVDVIGGTGPFTYSLDGGNFYSVADFNNLESGQYNLTIQDSLGCEWDTLVTLASPPELTVNLGGNQEINLGDSIRLDAIPNQAIDTFIWSNPLLETLSPYVQPIAQTGYGIMVTADGCEAEDYIIINVRKDRNIYLPTAFSPNGDGVNDYFMVYGDQSVTNIKTLRVFDRWGETVFAKDDLTVNVDLEGWDGMFKGKVVQPGVFVFFAEIEFFDGRVEVFKGDVTVVK